MRKLNSERKIALYEQWRKGASLRALSRQYGVCKESVKYLVKLIDLHGYGILRNGRCCKYAPSLKEQMIQEVLKGGHSITETALKYGLASKTTLSLWVHRYQQSGKTVIEHKRGRPRKHAASIPSAASGAKSFNHAP